MKYLEKIGQNAKKAFKGLKTIKHYQIKSVLENFNKAILNNKKSIIKEKEVIERAHQQEMQAKEEAKQRYTEAVDRIEKRYEEDQFNLTHAKKEAVKKMVKKAKIGDRVSINFSNLEKKNISRGSTLFDINKLEAVKNIIAKVNMVKKTKWLLKNNQGVHVNIGTSHTIVKSIFTISPAFSFINAMDLWRNISEEASFHFASVGGNCSPISPSANAPNNASVIACKATSASEWPTRDKL